MIPDWWFQARVLGEPTLMVSSSVKAVLPLGDSALGLLTYLLIRPSAWEFWLRFKALELLSAASLEFAPVVLNLWHSQVLTLVHSLKLVVLSAPVLLLLQSEGELGWLGGECCRHTLRLSQQDHYQWVSGAVRPAPKSHKSGKSLLKTILSAAQRLVQWPQGAEFPLPQGC